MSRTTLRREQVVLLADRLEAAQRGARAIARLTEDFPGMTAADGYAVQAELRRRCLARGERIVGWKAGLTSKAKMAQIGGNAPTIGFLASDMARPEGSVINTVDLVQPRAELEVAFVTSAPLRGPGCTREAVLAATDFVLPAIEVIDSRFVGFKLDLPSALADNSSSARFVGGGRARDPSDLDLRTLGAVMEKNGEIVAMGASAAVLGHPASAVAMLVNVLAEQDERLPAGSFVMSGAIAEAIPVKAGDVLVARFQELGSVSVRFG